MKTITLVEENEAWFLLDGEPKAVFPNIVQLFLSEATIVVWEEVECHYIVFNPEAKTKAFLVMKPSNDVIEYAETITVFMKGHYYIPLHIEALHSFYKANVYLVSFEDK